MTGACSNCARCRAIRWASLSIDSRDETASKDCSSEIPALLPAERGTVPVCTGAGAGAAGVMTPPVEAGVRPSAASISAAVGAPVPSGVWAAAVAGAGAGGRTVCRCEVASAASRLCRAW
ncbi:hypothetical protein DYI42_18695 [Vannielia litorea]|nr:hypothetical protein [Vannielia litorea]